MSSTINVHYVTNEQGIKTAVQISFKEWNKLLQDYSRLKHLIAMKSELKQGFLDLIAVEQKKSKEITLSEFLDEN